MAPSKSSVDKAGKVLRQWRTGQLPAGAGEALMAAFDTAWDYRRQFQYPLTMVNANLRYYVKKANCEVFIAQRLKRLPRIMDKLGRQPNMRLSQMQDVGGCRAILPGEAAVRDVLEGISRRWEIVTVDDYISKPKADGYRGIHVIVRKENVPIEVQLRTTGQQDWADEVERMDGLVPYALKDGEGPPEMTRYLCLLAELIASIEGEQTIDYELMRELNTLRRSMP